MKQTMHLQNTYYFIPGKRLNNCCKHQGMIFWCQSVGYIMVQCGNNEFDICSVPLCGRCCLQ